MIDAFFDRTTRLHVFVRLLIVVSILTSLLADIATSADREDWPQVYDDRLEITLFAEDPEIVTPIGMVIDEENRLFVIESHTHVPPDDYQGPKSDRIKVFVDRDGDSKCDDVSIYAEGLEAAMNLAFSPDGILYVVCAREVFSLHDINKDGVCDETRSILRLETKERYPHNCWLSITFSRDGWMYVGRGNVSSKAYAIVGRDGSRVTGYGDGGNIVRCRPDGSHVEEHATGFWNPFDIKFDSHGRLLCVDNDPDARGPNRFLHVVRGGDYGYRSLYGGGGNHPYQGWDGDVPGTLPMIGGTGEAPSGLLDCRRTSFPKAYEGSYLITIWNENTIERHHVQRRSRSNQAAREVLVRGNQDFRPVAIDADQHGNVFFTDWVLVNYPNHGRGRIWRMSPKESADSVSPRGYFDSYLADRRSSRLNELLSDDSEPSFLRTIDALQDEDAFVRHAGIVALGNSLTRTVFEALRQDPDPRVRLGCLLAAKRGTFANDKNIPRNFLSDADPKIVRAALQWIGESKILSLRADIDRVLTLPQLSGELFETYLATVRNLDPDFVSSFRSQAKDRSRDCLQPLPSGVVVQIAANDSLSDSVRALATTKIRVSDDVTIRQLLRKLATRESGDLQMAAIRQLKHLPRRRVDDVGPLLVKLAYDAKLDTDCRCEALLALSTKSELDPSNIIPLLRDSDALVRLEAARTLRNLKLNDDTRKAILGRLDELKDEARQGAEAEQLRLCLNEEVRERPKSLEQWKSSLAAGGDPRVGGRVFRSVHATCSKCHTVDGTGGVLGPDLSQIGRSVTREQIIHSILRPSDQFPPQYQAWQVLTADGELVSGLQLDHKAHGAIELFTTEQRLVRFAADEIEMYRAVSESVMPTGLEQSLGVFELRDLVAFLESQR